LYLVNERIGDSLTEEECNRLVSQLQEQQVVSREEASVMAAALSSRALAVPIPEAMKNAMRARILKSMLMTVAARNRN
jgi:transcriptional regulator CtsR